MVEGPCANDAHAVCVGVEAGREIGRRLAERVGVPRPEGVALGDREVVRHAVLLPGTGDQHAHVRCLLAQGLEQIQGAGDVAHHGRGRILPRARDRSLGRKMKHEVWSGLEHRALDCAPVQKVRNEVGAHGSGNTVGL